MTPFLSPPPHRACPICDAPDAFVEPLREGSEYYVECANCRVYRASRRAFRHFEYLRWRQDPDGLERLARLALYLKHQPRTGALQLEYESWEQLLQASSE